MKLLKSKKGTQLELYVVFEGAEKSTVVITFYFSEPGNKSVLIWNISYFSIILMSLLPS